eukprot:4778889-Alexandrium_andersonii.AAC.1
MRVCVCVCVRACRACVRACLRACVPACALAGPGACRSGRHHPTGCCGGHSAVGCPQLLGSSFSR